MVSAQPAEVPLSSLNSRPSGKCTGPRVGNINEVTVDMTARDARFEGLLDSCDRSASGTRVPMSPDVSEPLAAASLICLHWQLGCPDDSRLGTSPPSYHGEMSMAQETGGSHDCLYAARLYWHDPR